MTLTRGCSHQTKNRRVFDENGENIGGVSMLIFTGSGPQTDKSDANDEFDKCPAKPGVRGGSSNTLADGHVWARESAEVQTQAAASCFFHSSCLKCFGLKVVTCFVTSGEAASHEWERLWRDVILKIMAYQNGDFDRHDFSTSSRKLPRDCQKCLFLFKGLRRHVL